MGFLLVCSTRSSTYWSGRSSFCCDELTDAHLPADQQLPKRPIIWLPMSSYHEMLSFDYMESYTIILPFSFLFLFNRKTLRINMYKCMTGSSLWWWSSLCHGLDIVKFDTKLGHRKVFPNASQSEAWKAMKTLIETLWNEQQLHLFSIFMPKHG